MGKYISIGESLSSILEIYKDGDINVETVIMRIDEILNETMHARNQERMDEAHEEYMKTLKIQQETAAENIKLLKEVISLVKEK